MGSVEIISHLTKKAWKKSWKEKVVEDTKFNVREYHKQNCFFGHFINEDDFILYHHKEFEGNSMNTYFFGHVEKCEQGCKITGSFSKKKTANIFLKFGALLTLVTALVFGAQGQLQMMLAPAVLCVILILCLVVNPQSSRERLLDALKKISFSDVTED